MLTPYQIEALNILKNKKKALFSNPAGSGKTYVLEKLIKESDSTWLIICPLSDKKKWLKIPNCDVIHYNKISGIKAGKYQNIIVDEAHIPLPKGNAMSQRGKDLMRICSKTDRLILVSATPSVHSPLECFYILKLLHPQIEKYTKWKFITGFCCYKFIHAGIYGLVPVLDKKQTNPNKTERLKEAIKKVEVRTLHDSGHKIEVKKIHMEAVANLIPKKIEDFSKKYKEAGEYKYEKLKELNSFSFKDKLIFVHHSDLGQKVAQEQGCHFINGLTPVSKRHEIINKWGKKGKGPLVLSYGVGGVALDFKHAEIDEVLLLESASSPAVSYQAYSRLTRFKSRNIKVYYITLLDPMTRATIFKENYLQEVWR